MIALNNISESIPALKPSDSVERALAWMNAFKVTELPVVLSGNFLGIISESVLLDYSDKKGIISEMETQFVKESVSENTHLYEVVSEMIKRKTHLLPVLDESQTYLGVITTRDIMQIFVESLGMNETGGLVVLRVPRNSYSLSEIGHICEANNCKVLSLTIATDPKTGDFLLTLKFNITELSNLLATFESRGYAVHSVLFDSDLNEEYERNYQALLKYLDM